MHIGFWDIMTFVSFAVLGVGFLGAVVFILGLPGRIAYARRHPDAEAVNIMGWLGFLAVVPWMHAFLWAFKPVDTIDIRRTPAEEKKAIDEAMAEHAGKPVPAKPVVTKIAVDATHGQHEHVEG
jgi:hypothetical protein